MKKSVDCAIRPNIGRITYTCRRRIKKYKARKKDREGEGRKREKERRKGHGKIALMAKTNTVRKNQHPQVITAFRVHD